MDRARLRGLVYPTLALGVALLAWYLQVVWVTWDQGPPESDEWHHLTKAAFYLNGWQEAGWTGLAYKVVVLRTTFPPLVHLAALPFFQAFGFSTQAAALSLGPWLALLVLATWGQARRVLDEGGALVAALMVAASPLVISLSHKFLLDLSLAALVAATLWALGRSARLTRPGWVALSGGLFALALLAKFIAGVFLVGAYAWMLAPHAVDLLRRRPRLALPLFGILGLAAAFVAWQVAGWLPGWLAHGNQENLAPVVLLTRGNPPRLLWIWHVLGLGALALGLGAWRVRDDAVRALLGVAAAATLATWLAGCWYVPHLAQVLAGVASFTSEGGAGEGDPLPTTLRGWLYYPWVLGRVLPRSWFHLLGLGFVLALAVPGLRRSLGPQLGAILGAFLVMNLSPNKEARYILSLASVVCVLALAWTALLSPLLRWLVRGVVAGMAVFLLTSWIPVSRGTWSPPPALVWKDDRVLSSGISTPTQYAFPARVGWLDVLRTPDFYVVMPLPREMPWLDEELPFGVTGP